MAVLPPPSTMTRLPILSMWPKDTLESQSMPIWILAAAPRGREFRDRGRAVRRSRRRLRPTLPRAGPAGYRPACRNASTAKTRIKSHSSSITLSGKRNAGSGYGSCRLLWLPIKHEHFVAEAGRDRGPPSTRRAEPSRRPVCRSALGGLGQTRADVVLVVGGDPLQPADRDRLALDAPATTGRLAGTVASAAKESLGKRWIAS